jgi:hypothetical protein
MVMLEEWTTKTHKFTFGTVNIPKLAKLIDDEVEADIRRARIDGWNKGREHERECIKPKAQRAAEQISEELTRRNLILPLGYTDNLKRIILNP